LAKDIHQKLIPRIEKEQEVLFVTHNDLHEIIENREIYIEKYLGEFNTLPDSLKELSDSFKSLATGDIKKDESFKICASVYTEFLERNFEGKIEMYGHSLIFRSPENEIVDILSATFSIFINEFYHCFNKGFQTWDFSNDGNLMLRDGWDKYGETSRRKTLDDLFSKRSI